MAYIIPLVILLFCIYIYDYKQHTPPRYLLHIICGYYILLSGLSYRIGLDIVNFYVDEFNTKYPTLSDVSIDYLFETSSRQPGWLLFASICKSIVPSFYFMKTIIAAILNISMFIAIKRHTKYVYTGILLYSLLLFFYFNFEILRESLAISLFLMSTPYFETKKWKKYYMFIFIAILFHESATFLIFLPLINKIGTTQKAIFVYAFAALGLMLFASYFTWIPQMIASIPMFAEKAQGYIQSDYFGVIKTFTITRVLSYCLSIFLPIIATYYIKDYKWKKMLGYYVIAYVFIHVFTAFFPIMMRLGNYLSIFYFIFYIEILKSVIDFFIKRNNYILKTMLCAAYILYTIIPLHFMPQERLAGFPSIIVYYPYTSIIDEERVLEREIMYSLFFRRNV